MIIIKSLDFCLVMKMFRKDIQSEVIHIFFMDDIILVNEATIKISE